MRRSFLLWTLLSVLAFAGAAVFWQLGERRQRQKAEPPAAAPAQPAAPPASSFTPRPVDAAAGQAARRAAADAQAAREAELAAEARRRFPHQLTNTRQHLGQLLRSETAVLMQNALIETSERTALPVPAHLRSGGDPGAWIVQARGPVTDALRRTLAQAGANVIAYIPNNAFLVRAGVAAARALETRPGIQAVLPYEPYYKLQADLLARAVHQEPLPERSLLRVTGFPGEGGILRTVLEAVGAQVLFEDRSPFGPQLIAEPPRDALALLAQSPSVQTLEPYDRRSLLNDFTRLRLGVVTDTSLGAPNHPPGNPLTGLGITLNLNDTGVDGSHPDLSPRVTTDPSIVPSPLLDPLGHGTHVAGTIISSGANGTIGTNAPGSTNNANMRGIAFNASLYVLPVDINFGPIASSDFFLQTNAAVHNYSTLTRTNPMVSNNSWGYLFSRGYDSAAASYDAAVRDALPENPGMQPMIYVFAVGNEGFGANNGLGGFPDTIVSPATAKNVISVGAIESPRFITNTVVVTNTLGTNVTVLTNAIFLPVTDSSRQVASFSSRGNVDPGLEGLFGRFKPDVVAPGTFTISTRSAQYTNLVNNPTNQALDQLDQSLGNNFYRFDTGTSQAAPAISGLLALLQEFFEQRLTQGYSPALLKALIVNSARSLSSANPAYSYAVNETLNLQGWGLPNLTNIVTDVLGTPDSPVQFVDQDPALALATGDSVSFTFALNSVPTNQPQPGLFPLRFTLVWTDPPGNPGAAVKLVNDLDLLVSYVDTNGVTNVYVGNNFSAGTTFTPPVPLSTTNDTPLPTDRVNNVENIVIEPPVAASNLVISVRGARVNVNAVTAHSNNVVQDFALVVATGAPFATTNPVPGGYFTLGTPVFNPNQRPPVETLTNGLGVVRQRAGAHSPLLAGPLGVTNQWRFYVFTNSPPPAGTGLTNLTGGSNVAFVTFRPPNLSGSRHVPFNLLTEVAPRNVDADIDLYVSRDPLLLNLDPAALAAAARSTNRGGTEFVVFNDGVPDEVFYVGVKSEDHQGAEFSLLGLSTDEPFCQNVNGNIVVRFFGLPAVGDGSPLTPAAVSWIGLALNVCGEITVQRAVLTNTLTSELFGDVFIALSHAEPQTGLTRDAVVLSHNLFGDTNSGTITFIFDDSGRGDMPGAQSTDARATTGGLNTFVGEQGNGVWLYSLSDNAVIQETFVDEATMFLEARLSNNVPRLITLCAGDTFLDAVDIPPNATNFAINVANLAGGPVEIYVRRDDPATAAPELPTTSVYDYTATIAPLGGVLSITPNSFPPLQAGRYYVLFFNPNAGCISFELTYDVGVSSSPAGRLSFGITNGPVTLQDDSISISRNVIGVDREIYSVEVGVRLDHPRVSDLALHLVSPSGRRVLLMENRGLLDTNGLGTGYPITNAGPLIVNGGAAAQTNIINAGVNSGTLQVSFDFFNLADRMTVYYDGVQIFDSGFISGSGSFSIPFGPGAATDVVVVMNEPFGNSGTGWNYTATVISGVTYALFTEDTNKTTTPIKAAQPPFGGAGTPPVPVLFNGFEGAAAGNYTLAQIFDGWTVLTNQVSVITDPALAHTGNNLLALADGRISRVLPTVAGRTYQLTFAHRGPGSIGFWRGDNNALDSVGGFNGTLLGGAGFAAGKVNAAFDLNGTSSYVSAPDDDQWAFGAQDFTIDLWVNFRARRASTVGTPEAIFVGHDEGPGVLNKWFFALGGGFLNFHVNGPVPGSHFIAQSPFDPVVGQWYHLAVVRRGNLFSMYRDGVLIGSEVNPVVIPNPGAPLTIGWAEETYFMDGQLDEVTLYNRALTESELSAIVRADAAGKYDPLAPSPQNLAKLALSLDGGAPTIVFGSNTNWQTATLTFTAAANGTVLDLAGLAPGMLLDSFDLQELGQAPAIYLPEESLDQFRGESTLGTWRLELWDTRTGAAITNGLIAWDLRFILASTVPQVTATPLFSCVPHTNTIARGGIAYFYVDVPLNAASATNTLDALTGSGLRLSAARFALPVGASPPDDYPPQATGPAPGSTTLIMDTNTPPVLLPGSRYYLAVENLAPTETNTFVLTVCLGIDTNIVPFTFTPPPALTSAAPQGGTLAPGLGIDYYQVTISNDVSVALFELSCLNGNANLVIRRDNGSARPLPTRVVYDYGSVNAGTADELAGVTTANGPVPLTPGRWFLGVYNVDDQPVNYCVSVTQHKVLTNGTPLLLSNDTPLTFTIPGGHTTTNLYRFNVDWWNTDVLFEVYDISGDVDLFVGQGAFPSGTLGGLSAARGPRPEQVVFSVNSSLWDISGEYWLAVANHTTNAASFTLRAAVNQPDGLLLSAQPLVALPGRVVAAGKGLPLTWNSIPGQRYEIDVAAEPGAWSLYATVTAKASTTTFTDPSPLSAHAKRFFRVRQVPP
jgi:subtilisin-like proprotein convertase family protein